MEMFIDGEWRAATSGRSFDILDKSTGVVIDAVPRGSLEDAQIALIAASDAFPAWSRSDPSERSALLRGIASGLRASLSDFASIISAEVGRPMAGCTREVERCADLLDYFADEGDRLFEAWRTSDSESAFVLRQPVGVVVAITPFNMPLTLMIMKVGAALVAGCTVVGKPAEDSPLSTLKLADLAKEAGLPRGVLNVVTGFGAEIGQALVSNPIPAKIAFTGGTAAGRAIAREAVGQMKRLTLELGGQSPAIVCEDADLATAAKAVVRHGFANSGQLCYRVARVLVHEAVADKFTAQMVAETRKLIVGSAHDPQSDLGPVVGERILLAAERHVADARRKGARLLFGGKRLTGGAYDAGCYFAPTILADCTPDMLVMQEEAFSPVIGVQIVTSDEEALEIANGTAFGLAAFVFTADRERAMRLVRDLDAGSVWINDIQRSRHDMPFGGFKMSGLGREKSAHGIEAYLELKTVYFPQ